MKSKEQITQDELKALVWYEPLSGIFVWRQRPQSMFADKRRMNIWNAKYAGRIAGSTRKQDGYTAICIYPYVYLAHRLAWVYVHGSFPADQLDHINHDKRDNRIANLREVDAHGNCQNRSLSVVNTSGHIGVYQRASGKWRAELKIRGQKRMTGKHHDNIESAIAERQAMTIAAGFHPNHGKILARSK